MFVVVVVVYIFNCGFYVGWVVYDLWLVMENGGLWFGLGFEFDFVVYIKSVDNFV